MIDVINIRRLLKVVAKSKSRPLFHMLVKEAQSELKSKYNKFTTADINSIIRMAESEGYIKLTDIDFFDKLIAWKDRPIVITDVKGQRLLNKTGLIEAILETYSRTATFLSGGLSLAILGFIIWILKLIFTEMSMTTP